MATACNAGQVKMRLPGF